MCGGGGGGGSGTQQYNWNDTLAPLWQSILPQGQSLANQPYQQYQGQRIAGMTPDQTQAFQEVRNLNSMTKSPMDAINGAIDQTTNTLGGAYMPGGSKADPYAGQGNPYANQMITNGTNQYIGDSPQFYGVLNNGLQDIGNAYQQGTAADTTRMFNLSGAFGGSAHQTAMANNENALAKQMNQYVTGMQNDQYNRSAQLQEGQLGRDQQTDMYNKGQANQDYENFLNRGSQAYQNERGRQMSAVGLGNDQQGLGQQRATNLLAVGDANRSYNQDILNQNYNDYQTQLQYPYTQMDWLSGLLGRAQGGVSPNMTTQTSGYSASPFSQIAGMGLLGYGAFGGGK